MRFFRTRLHVYVSLVLLASLLLASIAILLLPRERATRANFKKVTIGMPLADVHNLLGQPEFDRVEAGPVSFATYHLGLPDVPDDRLQNYTRKRRTSPEITIVIISDHTDRIICCYSGEGQRRATVFEMVWHWVRDHF